MENIAADAYQIIHLHKYLALKRRCEEIQLSNEKLVNRIYNVKKILKRYKKERSTLMTRLDELGDNYQEAFVPAMYTEGAEEDEVADHTIPDEETDQAVASISGLSHTEEPVPAKVEPKKVKRVKTPSPYMLFCSHRKAVIQQQYLQSHGEEASRAEVTRLLSHEWAQITPEEKMIYVELAEQKKAESEAVQLPLTTVKQEAPQTVEYNSGMISVIKTE